jgi:hypothetical protein
MSFYTPRTPPCFRSSSLPRTERAATGQKERIVERNVPIRCISPLLFVYTACAINNHPVSSKHPTRLIPYPPVGDSDLGEGGLGDLDLGGGGLAARFLEIPVSWRYRYLDTSVSEPLGAPACLLRSSPLGCCAP